MSSIDSSSEDPEVIGGGFTEERLSKLGEYLFNDPASDATHMEIRTKALRLFDQLFFPSPVLESKEWEKRSDAFAGLIDEHLALKHAGQIEYALPYPKWEFFKYLTEERGFLLHGSSRALSVLRPNMQTDWNGRRIEAVFATSDPIWPIFFATLDWQRMTGSIRNGGFLVETPDRFERFYFFSANTSGPIRDLFRDGTIHVVDRAGFSTNPSQVRFDEWHHSSSVPVLAQIRVGPHDFPFLDRVTKHEENESIYATWLRYKPRLRAIKEE